MGDFQGLIRISRNFCDHCPHLRSEIWDFRSGGIAGNPWDLYKTLSHDEDSSCFTRFTDFIYYLFAMIAKSSQFGFDLMLGRAYALTCIRRVAEMKSKRIKVLLFPKQCRRQDQSCPARRLGTTGSRMVNGTMVDGRWSSRPIPGSFIDHHPIEMERWSMVEPTNSRIVHRSSSH
jgi:hypothetical protein